MKIFIVHKTTDRDEIEKIIKEYNSPDIKFLMLENKVKCWKHNAKKLIKEADIIVYFAGEKFSDNLAWELEFSHRIATPVHIIKLTEKVKIDSSLYKKGDFDGKMILKYNERYINDLDVMLKKTIEEKLFNQEEYDPQILLEQYKMLLSTSESLIERRQKTTTTFITIFSILLPVVTFLLSKENPGLNFGALLLSIMSIVMCVSWLRTIISYGKSNSAKFEIIENIEKKLPLSMFNSEWIALSRKTNKYVSFSKRETTVPKVFVFAYCILSIASAIQIVISHF